MDTLTEIHDDRTATVINDVSEQALLNRGVPKSALLRLSKVEQIPTLLRRGRIDYWAYGAAVAKYALKQRGLRSRFAVKYSIDSQNLFYAFHPASDPAAIDAFAAALARVKGAGRLQAIKDRYLN